MNEEQMKALLEGFSVSLATSVDSIKTDLGAQLDKANGDIAALGVELAAVKAQAVVAPVVPVQAAAVVAPAVAAVPLVDPPRVTAASAVSSKGKYEDSKTAVAAVWASDKSSNDKWVDAIKLAKVRLEEAYKQ